MNYKVYCHIFPNKKMYIGITQQDVYKRWKRGKGYEKQKCVYSAIKKYGWDNIKHIILFDNLTKNEAETKEIELIRIFKTNNRCFGYNIANGGNCSGTVSDETKAKISKAHKGKHYYQGYWKGKKLSDEHRKKLSLSHKGQKSIITETTKKKISKTLQGHEVTYETRKKIAKPVICIETGKIYYSAREASKQTNVQYKNISSVCNKKRKTAGGYHWEFIGG